MKIVVRHDSPCHHCADYSQRVEYLSDSVKPQIIDDCSVSPWESCPYARPAAASASIRNITNRLNDTEIYSPAGLGGLYIEGENDQELVGVNLADFADGYATISSEAEATRDTVMELSERLRALEALFTSYGTVTRNISNEREDWRF